MVNRAPLFRHPTLAEVLALAATTRRLSPVECRMVVTGIFRDALYIPGATEASIFSAAYDDPLGSKYWDGWLEDEFSSLFDFVEFLEIHRGKRPDTDTVTRSPILEAIAIAAKSSPPWLKGDTDAIIRVVNHPQYLAGCDVKRGSAVRWMYNHSEHISLLSSSMLSHLRRKDGVFGNYSAQVATLETGRSKNSNRPRASRQTTQKCACDAAFAVLFPLGIPEKRTLSDKRLAADVAAHIKGVDKITVSPDTILRAAGRKTVK